MEIIDVLGQPCPIPVIKAKKALAAITGEGGVVVKVDNIVAVENIEKMAKGLGYVFSFKELARDSFEVYLLTNGSKHVEIMESASESKIELPTDNSYAVVIGRNTMGAGSEDLGKILIKGFIFSLTECEYLPKYVLFLNSGVFLTSSDSNTIDDLKTLEQKGTRVYTCGTCLNYYEIKDKLGVGEITDMYGITQKMIEVGKVINI